MKSTKVEINEHLHRRLKQRAAKRGVFVKQLVEALIMLGLDNLDKKEAK